jgi:hypothetical protein
LAANISRFSTDGENHLLNGVLFEIYFDSEGRFRDEGLKTAFFDEINGLSKNKDYSLSFTFINEQLQSFRDELFFIPSPEVEPLNFDMVVEKLEKDKLIEYKVVDIRYEGIDILRKSENSWFARGDNEIYYEPYTYSRLKEKISAELGVPKNLLTINPNYHLDADSKVLYPFGSILTKK